MILLLLLVVTAYFAVYVTVFLLKVGTLNKYASIFNCERSDLNILVTLISRSIVSLIGIDVVIMTVLSLPKIILCQSLTGYYMQKTPYQHMADKAFLIYPESQNKFMF
jgi:hypothetical protein